jgi:hypothetical protein
MPPEWLDQVTGRQIWETLVWVGAVVGGLSWLWAKAIKPRLARIEADAKRAVANTQSDGNGGHSPHDQLVKLAEENAVANAKIEDTLECLRGRVDELTQHLGANHPGAVDPDSGRPVMPPPVS